MLFDLSRRSRFKTSLVRTSYRIYSYSGSPVIMRTLEASMALRRLKMA